MGGSSYVWDFGDGETLTTTGSQVTHYYDTAGVYTVTLTITNSCGNTGTYSNNVTVIDGGGATASAAVTTQLTCNGGSNAAVAAAGVGGSLPYTYTWDDPSASTTDSVVI